MYRRPTVEPVADVCGHTLVASQCDGVGDEPLLDEYCELAGDVRLTRARHATATAQPPLPTRGESRAEPGVAHHLPSRGVPAPAITGAGGDDQGPIRTDEFGDREPRSHACRFRSFLLNFEKSWMKAV